MTQDDRSKTNLVLLTVDALRPDHLSSYGYSLKTDEALDPFRNKIAVFKNAYTYSMATVRSFPAIMASIWPDLCETKVLWQYVKKLDIPYKARMLAEIFQDHGYHTIAHTCWTNFLTPGQGYARGFDDYVGISREDHLPPDSIFNSFVKHTIYTMRYCPSKKMVHFFERSFHWLRETYNALSKKNLKQPVGLEGRNCVTVTNYILDRLTALEPNKPFMAWAHYLDTHIPLNPPEENQGNRDKLHAIKRILNEAIMKQKPIRHDLMPVLLDLYDRSILHVFSQINRIFKFLERRDQLKNTCIVILADHGYGFWEHGYWETPPEQFYDESIRVPLMIYHPELSSGMPSIEQPVSLIDLAPSLLNICGISEENTFFGESFVSLLQEKSSVDPKKSIWIETIDDSHFYCRIKKQSKIIYDQDGGRFLLKLNHQDRVDSLLESEQKDFLDDLKLYERSKREFAEKIKT